MKSLLVISNEPALAETLASELTELNVTGVRVNEAESHVHNGSYCLIVIDSDTHYTTDMAIENIIQLSRPIRLCEAIYTISQRLKSKTASEKEEIELTEDYTFSFAERMVRSKDGAANITLTEKEAELLQYLIYHNEDVLSRDDLLKKIWGYGNDINTHTLETHIYRLRNKLKQASQSLDIISLEEGGYRLRK